MKITEIHARQILDSRDNPTMEADVILEGGASGRAAVPSGASVGAHEAIELRDNDPASYSGKGVLKAIGNVNGEIKNALLGYDAENQKEIDKRLIELDGTPNKGRLGANAILAVSLAVSKAAANAKKIPLFEYFGILAGNDKFSLPVPLINIINGGRHAAGSTDIQEFMLVPAGAKSFSEAMKMSTAVFHALGEVLNEKNYGIVMGDEGGYALAVREGNEEALKLMIEAINKAGFTPGKEFFLALDIAASELKDENGYKLGREGKILSSDEMMSWLKDLSEKYPIISIEDGLDEEDWDNWTRFTAQNLGLQIVGDDLLVTNTELLKKAIERKAGNAILIKPNQIGTLTESIEAVKMAQAFGWRAIISHRSGETKDTTIAHLAVGLNAGQIKTGSVSQAERIAKYDELIRIEEILGKDASYPGLSVFQK
ncbi:MAG: phosphopyruvate hydratase [Minisyncoccia bacterium]